MNQVYCIYKIINLLKEKIYIGMTSNPNKRWEKHKAIANQKRNKEKFYLHRAMHKYGIENFSFEIIEENLNLEEAKKLERFWISKLDSKNTGYNLTDGGEGVFGKACSEETKKKISAAHMGMKHTSETKEKLRIINTGRKHQKSSLEKMSKANKGKQLSEEHKIKLSIAHKGKKKSPEHIAKMIANRKEKVKNNPEHRAFLKEISKKAAKSINFPRGSNSKHAKLHEDDVVKIKQLVADGIAAKDVAIQFNVSKRTILNIINKTSWRHVI